jgi:hypothetical protein
MPPDRPDDSVFPDCRRFHGDAAPFTGAGVFRKRCDAGFQCPPAFFFIAFLSAAFFHRTRFFRFAESFVHIIRKIGFRRVQQQFQASPEKSCTVSGTLRPSRRFSARWGRIISATRCLSATA